MDAKIDAKWFRLMIARADYSQRAFAAKMGMDPSNWLRVLNDKRNLKIPEVDKIAQLLNVSRDEVLAHAGGKTATSAVRDGASTYAVASAVRHPVGGTVDAATGRVTFTLRAAAADIVALDILGDAFLSGRQLLVRPSDVAAPASGGEGMGVLQLDDGRVVIGKYKAAFTLGRFDIGPVLGFGQRMDDVRVVGVIPVVGMDMGTVS